jgi:hypothetical protein
MILSRVVLVQFELVGGSISDRINAIAGALSGGGGGPHGRGVLCHAAGSSHLVSMPTRAVLDSDILGALLRGQNPFDRICAPSCCCRAAVRGYSGAVWGYSVVLCVGFVV